MEGPGRFAYLCEAAVVVWTVEAAHHQIKRGFAMGRVLINIVTRAALIFWLVG